MLLGWFDARQATEVGITLADQFASHTVSAAAVDGGRKSPQRKNGDALLECLRHAAREVRALPLNFYKKAKLANAFKWRLLERGVDGTTAAEATQSLVMHLSLNRAASIPDTALPVAAPADQSRASKPRDLLASAAKSEAEGAYEEAMASYNALIEIKPRHAIALNNLGAILGRLSRLQEAEQYFRRAISAKADYAEAHYNLGSVLRGLWQFAASERSLRHALKLKPNYLDAHASLGVTLVALARPADARVHLDRVLRAAPRHVIAMLAMAQVCTMEGRFEEAESLFKPVLDIRPNDPSALAAQVDLRKMTSADSGWLKRAEQAASGTVPPAEEISLRFAIGKYCDDVEDFAKAFQSYRRGNEILKALVEQHDQAEHARFVDDMIRVYTPDRIGDAARVAADEACASMKPVFVVGMPRSGTSLVEQIIASHPAAAGAGELAFWTEVVRQREATIRQGLLDEAIRKELAHAYLRTLGRHSSDALRVVDKAPINSDFLGVIHSAFPKARILYLRRHPIDTCLSCYFQQFSASMNFTTDLENLAHYYRQHHRLITHWRAVLPPGTLLDVPYAELVTDQEQWTRRIVDFIGLEWDKRCLDFQDTKRTVATASAWQVRQRIYKSSVERWRNYAKFIGPLRDLQDLNW